MQQQQLQLLLLPQLLPPTPPMRLPLPPLPGPPRPQEPSPRPGSPLFCRAEQQSKHAAATDRGCMASSCVDEPDSPRTVTGKRPPPAALKREHEFMDWLIIRYH